MTIAITWIRKTKAGDELIFASDSRLTGGSHVDTCQKVFALPRNDGAIAFAGSTAIAYPFILQLMSVLGNHRKMKDRTIDFCKIPAVIKHVLSEFIISHSGFDQQTFLDELKATEFLIAGWSSIYQKFIIRRLSFQNSEGKHVLIKKIGVSHRWGLEKKDLIKIAFIGDHIPDVLQKLQEKLKGTGALETLDLDYEPLEILTEMLADPLFTNRKGEYGGIIGGAPQVLKVYRRCQSPYFQIKLQRLQNAIFYQGRPVMKFEDIQAPTMEV